MADYAPVYGRPKAMTFTAGAAIVGGNLVYVSAADTVSPAALANPNPIGVAAHDAASGSLVTVLMGAGVVHETPTSVAFPTAGVAVYAGAGGAVTPTAGSGIIVGYAVRAASGSPPQTLRWKSVA
jgi:Uncharacterized conserved protein (DUF2190)